MVHLSTCSLFLYTVYHVITRDHLVDGNSKFKSKFFKSFPGISVTSPGGMARRASSILQCASYCAIRSTCKYVIYDKVSGDCFLMTQGIAWSHQQTSSHDDRWLSVNKQSDTDWQMVFRATRGIGVRAYDHWMNSSYHDDNFDLASSIPIGCLTVDTSLPCDRHFRTRALDEWKDVKYVQFAFFRAGSKVAYVTFDGSAGADKDSSFTLQRLISSSYPELIGYTGALNFFSTAGDVVMDRRFYISMLYDSCPKDLGWILVADGRSDPGCSYENSSISAYPQFLYCEGQSHCLTENSAKYADVFAVFIKTST
ncbi:uncharacterized protein LOC101864651 [Aplysia californica]|uniref:Uncharacterized protein LOC101864651 n=1 Tax=Aplysia californica TaxID=6500 RepID=A0ABM1AAF3_APLCA|nr:uncharacterized protein LOC101864651 [Aplysia californica]